MTATLSVAPISVCKSYVREQLKAEIHQPVPDDLIQDLISGINKESEVILADAGCLIALSLIENGHNPDKIFVAEGFDGHYKRFAKKLSQDYGFHHIEFNLNELPSIMNFDNILGNPPFQSNNGGGSYRGSTSNPFWWQVTKNSISLLKNGGTLSFITPTNIVNGGDSFTKLVLGPERKYDLISVDFSADDYFKVGIPICRWVLKKTKTKDHKIIVNDGRVLNADTTLKINNNSIADDIMNKILSYDGKKLNFNQSNSYDFRSVARYLEKQNLPVEWAKDLKLIKDDVYQYPVNINGKIKYSRVKWKNNGVWRLFIAKMQNPFKVEISNEWEADGSTFTMVFDSEEDALLTQSYLNNPVYLWIIEQTRVSGRVNGTTISKLPNINIEEVLSEDQLNYIQSQL
jgi:hypothetical protein